MSGRRRLRLPLSLVYFETNRCRKGGSCGCTLRGSRSQNLSPKHASPEEKKKGDIGVDNVSTCCNTQQESGSGVRDKIKQLFNVKEIYC